MERKSLGGWRSLGLVLAWTLLLGGGPGAVKVWAEPPIQSSAEVTRLLSAAEAELSMDDPAAALRVASQVLATVPESGAAHALAGRAAAQAGEPARAKEHLRQAVALGHKDPRTRLYLAAAFWDLEDYDAAEREYRDLLTTPVSGPAFVAGHQLGRLLLWLGRAGEAVGALDGAVALRPGAFDALLDLARALEANEELVRAEEVYRRAIAREPASIRAHWGLGHVLTRLGRREEAREVLARYQQLIEEEQAQTRQAGLVRADLDRAHLLLTRGDAAAALDAFRTAGNHWEALFGAARALAALGHGADAVRTAERALAMAPGRLEIVRWLAGARAAGAGSGTDEGATPRMPPERQEPPEGLAVA